MSGVIQNRLMILHWMEAHFVLQTAWLPPLSIYEPHHLLLMRQLVQSGSMLFVSIKRTSLRGLNKWLSWKNSGASSALSWLGEPDRSSRYISDSWLGVEKEVPMAHGFPLIRAVSAYIDSRRDNGELGWNDDTVLTAQDFQWIAQNPDFYTSDMEELAMNLRWNAIVRIRCATYWTTIWIVQEMVLASSPHQHLIYCGAEYVSYHQLNNLHDFLQKVHDQRPPSPSFMPQALWGIMGERTSMEFTMMHTINYLRDISSNLSARIVPYVARYCSCTEPRDNV